MTYKLAVVMDPIQNITIKKDTTFAMLLEAQRRNYEIYYLEQKDLFFQGGVAYGNSKRLEVVEDLSGWFSLSEEQIIDLGSLDIILMRKDPPVDQDYIYTTYLLDIAEKNGALVVNKPRALRDANEKLYTLFFPDVCTDMLVTRNIPQLMEFFKTHGTVVFKPLDSMGGRSIFVLQNNDPNAIVIAETLTQFGTKQIMAQKFLSDITKTGDKRIILIDGKPVPYALARMPAEGGIRGNLAAGGHGIGVPLSQRDYQICERLAPSLKSAGLMFVGIDVIGDYLTEINVTSPTCVRELDKIYDLNICAELFDGIEAALRDGRFASSSG